MRNSSCRMKSPYFLVVHRSEPFWSGSLLPLSTPFSTVHHRFCSGTFHPAKLSCSSKRAKGSAETGPPHATLSAATITKCQGRNFFMEKLGVRGCEQRVAEA